MLNGVCWDDDYTIAQWLEHRWLEARVPGSSPGGDSQFFLQTFPVCLFPSNQLIIIGHPELIRCFGSLHSSVPGSVGFIFDVILFFILVTAVCMHDYAHPTAFVHQAS